MAKTIEFYTLLGFKFPEYKDEPHFEPNTSEGSARLMIDTAELIEEITGEKPKPGNHSAFAVQCESAEALDKTVDAVRSGGFAVSKDPWDTFGGQRYAIVQDLDGYKIDLYAQL